jgi:peptide/nickel transport system substrate-binding protein
MRKALFVLLALVLVGASAFAGAQREVTSEEGATTQAQTAKKGALSVADFVDPKIPKEWYGPYPLASERGVRSFNEAPMLAARVRAGEIPPVEERLPKDPPVVVPYDQVGKYGGTAIVWAQENNYRGDTMSFSWPEAAGDFPAGKPTPDGRQIIPYVLAGWDYSSDATQMTVNFREGVKWSDGVEVTADDMMFWWEHVAWNQLINSTPPDKMTPVPLKNVEKLGKYSVRFTFAGPNPRQHHLSFYVRLDPGRPFNPAHFMKDYHPDFVGEAKVTEMAKAAGFDNWAQFYLHMAGRSRGGAADRPDQANQAPSVRPFVYIERGSQGMVWERNPYWPFVDTEGNQLPYIDQVRVNLASNPEIAAAKMITGEADLSARFTATNDIPLYKANEEKGGYRTFIYHRVYGSDVGVLVNLSHRDPAIREIFWDVRFRRAVSHALDRNEINNKVYFGQAVVMQATVPPVSQYFKQEYADAYVDYDPDKARALLDEMGMVDKDGDGWRDRPDGQAFRPVLVHAKIGPVDPTPVVELMKPMFDDIGLNIEMKAISRQLHDTMWPANEGDIHALLMDQMVDTAFGVADRDLSPAGVGEGKDTPWPAYRTWYITNHEKGMEPPQILKDTIEWRETLATSPSQAERAEAARKLAETQAEYLWYIGTVAMAPHPVMVSNRLKNVPEKGIWDWRSTYLGAYRSQQFYIDE